MSVDRVSPVSPARRAAVLVSVALFTAYWMVVVVGLTVTGWVRDGHVAVRDPLILAGWTLVVAAFFTAVWQGRPQAVRTLAMLGRLFGALVVVFFVAVTVLEMRYGFIKVTSPADYLPGLLSAVVLWTGGTLLRRPEVRRWVARAR